MESKQENEFEDIGDYGFESEPIVFDWLPNVPELMPFYKGVCDFVEEYVSINATKSYDSEKEILDPCVGYVKLFSWEVAILDTKLFQRLRKITQLGLAYQVYPTLRYSRFEHTIGVLGRLNQSLQKLLEKHLKDPKIPLSEILEQYGPQIRLAALFHDVGHCLFSHLSEFVINELQGSKSASEPYPSVAFIKEAFNRSDNFQNTGLTIAEIFSVTIIGMPKIADLLFKANFKVATPQNKNTVKEGSHLKQYMLQVARFIAGLPVEEDPNTVFLAQLVSSGLDADKLDYMSREEHFSGIKIEMDLVRIFNKIKLFAINDVNELPKDLVRYTEHIKVQGPTNYIVLGIEKGGQFSYEEFCVARLALYEKIYLHKKVRASEAYLQKKLEYLANTKPEFQKAHSWLYLVESITEREQYRALEQVTSSQFNIFTNAVKKEIRYEVQVDFTDIENRQLPYRAYGFGPANAKTDHDYRRIVEEAEFTGLDSVHKLDSIGFWEKLNPKRKFHSEEESLVEDFMHRIITESIKLLKALQEVTSHKRQNKEPVKRILKIFKQSKEESPDDFSKRISNELISRIIIDVPDYRRVQLKYGSLYFEEASYQTVRWTIPIDQIARYYQLHRILAYVYTDYEICPLLMLACERVVYNYFEGRTLVFDQKQAISNTTFEAAYQIKDFLQENTVLYKAYRGISTLNSRLLTVSAKEKINSVVKKLDKVNFESKSPTYLDVENFLRQFDEEIQVPALNLLTAIKVLPNDELTPELEKIISSIRQANPQSSIGIIPLGSHFSSAGHMMKSYKNFIHSNNIRTDFLNNEETALQQDHLLLFDDNINSGIQALNIIAKLLKRPTEKMKAENLFMDKLSMDGEAYRIESDRIIAHLKKIRWSFVFITGHESSKDKLIEYLNEYCDLKDTTIEVHIKYILSDRDKIFSGAKRKESEYNSKNIFQFAKSNLSVAPSDLQALQVFLDKIGTQLVKERSICRQYLRDEIDHSLGYYNRESVVIFSNSIPTMTVTALWCSGKIQKDGVTEDWIPIIPRPIVKM
jgi:hypothetical protein